MDFKENPKADFKDIAKLTPEEAVQEAKALRQGIDYHDVQYYVKNRPVISDDLYDKLFRRLQELEENFSQIPVENSPTQRIGAAPMDKARKVRHTGIMLSLEAALEERRIRDFYDFVRRRLNRSDVRFTIEPKFDGLSVELVYER